jgi:hypothetical protein
LGLPPTLGPDSELVFQKISEDWDETWDFGLIKWEECSLLRDRRWRDVTGTPVAVPAGDMSDPHHSFCFRVFNMERELTAHKYEVKNARPIFPGDWARVFAQLVWDVEPPPPPASPKP